MTGPKNAVVGELDLPTNIPETYVPEEMLDEEKKMAKYSQTAEFKRLKEFLEARIQFYQRFLPNGTPVKEANMSQEELAASWKTADIVITEFKNILDEYQRAQEIVTEHGRTNT